MGQALYRKYRPKRLSEIVGQEHVTTTLVNALKNGRISHAYLLSGPRGVGKTSIARILAHEINGLPYTDEAHLDIIEIDAASNRRIDEIRDLRERVNTAPSAAKYKVYIIDEVHMLTKEAFNALLKTLEEPPAHVVFILATTEAHKLPETIVSRTQRYSLRPVPEAQVIDHLKAIAKGEKLQIDDDALSLIAQHGEGSFRDSISLLDQASSLAANVTKADVERILGLAPDEYIARLRTAVDRADGANIVGTLTELYSLGYEPAMISHQLSTMLRAAVLAGQTDDSRGKLLLLQKLLDVPAARSPKQLLELILLQSALVTTSSPVLTPTGSIPQSATAASALEAPQPAITNTPAPDAAAQAEAVVNKSEEAPALAAQSRQPASSNVSEASIPAAEAEQASTATTAPAETATNSVDATELWGATLEEIKKQYNTLYGIARMAKPEFDGQHLTLAFKFAFHQKRINEAKNRKIFADVIERLYGSPVEITCVVAEATIPTEGSSDISAVSNIFGGAELLN